MSEVPSVRESLTSAMSALSEPAPAAAPTPQPEAVAAPEPAEITAPDATTQAAPERDENGRFKAKEQTAQAGAEDPATLKADTQPETAKPAEPEPQTEAIRVPPSLPASVKAKFAALDPDVREAIWENERSVHKARDEWAKKGERLNRYDEIVGPHRDKWQLNGLDEFSGIQTLIAAQNFLERNPVEGLHYLARSYGVDLRALAGQALQQPTAPGGIQAPTVMPELQGVLQPLVQQVQTLQQQLQQSQQQSEHQKLAEAQAEVQTFANDPANLYFENVREEVAALLDAGRAKTLADAYQKAIWASDEIRPLLIAEQTKQQQADTQKKAAENAARAKAAAAQQAAGSVTGAPAPGAQAPKGPPGSIRDTLNAAMQEIGYQV